MVQDKTDSPFLNHSKAFRGALRSPRLHFAAHSHHPWPDCTKFAQTRYWEDSVRLLDHKWRILFEEKIPEAQKNILHALGGTQSFPASQVALAPNTHEFVMRLFSSFPLGKKIRCLTTDSEFHSFTRQAHRLVEEGLVELTQICVQPFETFHQRWNKAVKDHTFDLIFVSHVFYNSGLCFEGIASTIEILKSDSVKHQQTLFVVDGYHSYFAMPLHLNDYLQDLFFLGGSYKYAMSGEGLCFLTVPVRFSNLKPWFTGWFADFEHLDHLNTSNQTTYSKSGFLFAGSTMDFSALYRFNSVCNWLHHENLSISDIHNHVLALRHRFDQTVFPKWPMGAKNSKIINFESEAHFTALNFESPTQAHDVELKLNKSNIIVDRRGSVVRFGFGLYQNLDDLGHLSERLATVTNS